MKLSAGTGFVILGLALAIWAICYIAGWPLTTSGEVAVLVGLCAVVVLAGKWIWGQLRPAGGPHGQA